MSLIAYPTSDALKPENFALDLVTNQRVFGSPFGSAAEQVTDLLNDRWEISFDLPNLGLAAGQEREAFFNAMRGMTNWTALWHMARPQPLGTMRGTPTLQANALQGADSIAVQGLVGDTLVAGDMVGVGGLLLQVATAAAANPSGILTVQLVNRLRAALTAGAAVTWSRPTALFRLATNAGVRYRSGYYVDGTSLSFIEKTG